MRGLLLCLLYAVPVIAVAEEEYAEVAGGDDHVVILVYHHVATDTPASTSVSPRTFEAHLDYLAENRYNVLPLDEVLWRLAKGKAFPPDSVAITFDDAYESVYSEAWPRLKARNWPFAVFVSTRYIDQGFAAYMDWEQLAALSAAGVLIGNHGVTHSSAVTRGDNESRADWLDSVEAELREAAERIRIETGVAPRVLAWPYGEFNEDVEQIAADLGWYGLGQQSGPAGHDSSLTALPRFPVAASYARIEAFAERINTEPLPVRLRNLPPRLRDTHAPPTLLLFLDDPRFERSRVSCFSETGERLDVEARGDHSLAVTATEPLPAGRSKYTCTAPHRGKPGVYGWYSHPWIVAPTGG